MLKKYILFFITFFLFININSVIGETYAVTKTDDTNDGICNEDCSLREAVTTINKNKYDNEQFDIILPAGEFNISTYGELILSPTDDIDDPEMNIRIFGAGTNQTIITGDNKNRIFKFIYIDYNSFTIELSDLTLKNGYAVDNGGAIAIVGADTLLLDNVNFENNYSVQNGGAIYSNSVYETEINYTNFSNNTATQNGGAIYFDLSTELEAAITNTRFINNTATQNGGAIYFSSYEKDLEIYSADLTNLLFFENQATNGGAIFNNLSTVNLSFNTFYNNSAAEQGSAIYQENAQVNLYSNVIYSNTEKSNCFNNGINNYLSAGYNIENQNTCNLNQLTDLISTDPLLDEQAAPTIQSLTINKIPYSNCLDYSSLDSSYHKNYIRYDLNDKLRISQCDIGCYEYWPDQNLQVTSITSDNNQNATFYYNNGTQNTYQIFTDSSINKLLIEQYNENLAVAFSATGKDISLINLYDGAIFDSDIFSRQEMENRLFHIVNNNEGAFIVVLAKNIKKDLLKISLFKVYNQRLKLHKSVTKIFNKEKIVIANSEIRSSKIIFRNKNNKIISQFKINYSLKKIK